MISKNWLRYALGGLPLGIVLQKPADDGPVEK